MEAVTACPPPLQGLLFQNIVVAGGSTKFPNFCQRLELELRPMVPDEYTVGITPVEDPILCAWKGASNFSQTQAYQDRRVTRKQYLEHGSTYCREKFQC